VISLTVVNTQLKTFVYEQAPSDWCEWRLCHSWS